MKINKKNCYAYLANINFFSGIFGKVLGPPVEIKLREKVKPFQSQAYTIPQAYMQMALSEIFDLVSNGILV